MVIAFVLGGRMSQVSAQDWAVKTNILSDATATVNIGVEIGVAPKWTVDISGAYNNWSKNEDVKWKHTFIQPEVRYWFCESFNGHFIGINGNYSQFNVSAIPVPNVFFDIKAPSHEAGDPKVTRNQGWAAGAGITYGYQWILGKRWNLEATVGLGYWYTVYDQFESRKCGLFQNTIERHMVGPTRCGLSFIYLFK